ncbi:hypothetical protein V1517DRAFT_306518 [Lipomyces orientalis]|uniref:Uncharacterized protein n=1 Tax=Lipomyces orientalis TaxID=1233043 RepID=A0ACC3TST5_9ASCO
MQLRLRVTPSAGHTRSDFKGRWSQSSKTPEGDLRYTSLSTGRTGTGVIIEVGVSENMRKLVRDAETWLIGLRDEVSACIVITLDEWPPHHMPSPGVVGPVIDIDEEAAAADVAMAQDRMDACADADTVSWSDLGKLAHPISVVFSAFLAWSVPPAIMPERC